VVRPLKAVASSGTRPKAPPSDSSPDPAVGAGGGGQQRPDLVDGVGGQGLQLGRQGPTGVLDRWVAREHGLVVVVPTRGS
jgi:hypothetical protein